MKSIFHIIVVLLFSCATVLAQKANNDSDYVTKKTMTGKAEKYYVKAQHLGMQNKYEQAIKYYNKALEEAPDFIEAHLYIADAYYALEDFETAEEWFEKVLLIDETYNTRVIYVLAALEYRLDKFDEAEVHFELFLKHSHPSKELLAKAEYYLKTSRFAAEAVKNPLSFDPKNLGAVNTELPEYLPCFTADGNHMIYTSRYAGQEDFFQSERIDGEWTQGVNLGEPVNTMDNEGAQTISADGRFLVFTACNRREDFGSCDLYIAEKINGQWSTPQNIGANVNTSAWESQPSLSADGRTLYFVSSRAGGNGKKDIWVTYKRRNGEWMTPRNLGDEINTTGDEASPFIHADGQTLYFSSNGHVGMGESDIFMTTRQADGTWSKPQNLGYPINTKKSESSLVVSLDGTTGYFASDRTDTKGATDIYSFEMPESIRPKPVTYLKAKVVDAETRLEIKAKIELIQLSTGLTYTESYTNDDGEFLICLPSGDDYALNVSRKDYLFYSENFALKEATSFDQPFEALVELQPISEPLAGNDTESNSTDNKPVILKNVFFETGSATLIESSKVELDKLVVLLTDNPTMKIQINGHTDNVGTPESNQTLSLNRAISVMNYLVENGIQTDRLRAKGFGESQPIASNETEEGRRENRRTEFVLLK